MWGRELENKNKKAQLFLLPPDLCIPGIGIRPDFQELAMLSMMADCGDLAYVCQCSIRHIYIVILLYCYYHHNNFESPARISFHSWINSDNNLVHPGTHYYQDSLEARLQRCFPSARHLIGLAPQFAGAGLEWSRCSLM